MADIETSLIEIFKVEFNNDPKKFLHTNFGEDGWTLGGIYQKANPSQIDWNYINALVDISGRERASVMLYHDYEVREKVQAIYFNSYWSPLRLNQVHSQKVADEIFMMGVVSGVRNSAKIAQSLVGVVADGMIGSKSLEAINRYNEDEFSRKFDQAEIDYFASLVKRNPRYERFFDGWVNRARAV